jgi:hypothetical protein
LRHILIIILTLGNFSLSLASDAPTDLHWFKYVLKFSRISEKDLAKYQNPLEGPLKFRLEEKDAPWAGNYFPMLDGGIADRWQTGQIPRDLYDKQAIQSLSPGRLHNLSPVEKYDILMGYYDFRTTLQEMEMRGHLRDAKPEYWEGFCNGVRCAGLRTEEPFQIATLKNKDGIQVSFSPADIKALMGASYFYVEKYAQLGSPTGNDFAENQPNPAIFDLVLRYHLALHKKGFVIDSNLGPEIWNETVVGYDRKLSEVKKLSLKEQKKFPEAVSKIKVDLTLDTLGEVDIFESDKLTKSKVADGSLLTTLNSSYVLYLDSEGKAIDGQWLNKAEETRGVDFAWFAGGKGSDQEYSNQGGNPYLDFDVINKILKKSLQPICAKVLLK